MELSTKNTKNKFLAACDDLLLKVQETKTEGLYEDVSRRSQGFEDDIANL